MKLLFIVNPISGGKNKQVFLRDAETLCKKYGIVLEYYNTTGENDVEKATAKIQEVQPEKVVAVGGDGTVLMTAMALIGLNIPMGIVPMGSANGMAKELQVPASPIQALKDIIMSQHLVPLDLVKVNGAHYSLHLGDVGINAMLVEKFTQEKNRGWMAYAKHYVEAVKNTEKFSVHIEIDGKAYTHEAFGVRIANARMYGTGAIVNPQGNPHDGYFEVVVIKKKDLSGIINLGLTRLSETALDALKEYYTDYKVKKVKLTFEEDKMLQLDGELIGRTKEIEAEIVSAAVQYITTTDNHFLKEMNFSLA